jgi:hypothetical protein
MSLGRLVPDPDLVVARPKVEGEEVGGALKAVEDFIDPWDGDLVLDRAFVQGTIVLAPALLQLGNRTCVNR